MLSVARGSVRRIAGASARVRILGKGIVRLRDIAARTGFSLNTVSLALRNSERIPVETRNKIQSAALELRYVPNQIAKSLVSRETRTIGLVLTDILNPTLTQTAQAVEIALAAKGYGTLFATSNNTLEEEIKVVDMFRSRQVDGILIYPARHRDLEHLRPLRRANFPLVLLIADPDAGHRRRQRRRSQRRLPGDPLPDWPRPPAHRLSRRLALERQRRKARRLPAGPDRGRHRDRSAT